MASRLHEARLLFAEATIGQFLIDQGRIVDHNVGGIVKGSGHWLIDEAPDQVFPEACHLSDAPSL